LHFGQNYKLAIADSTDINVPYSFAYNRTYTFYWNLFYGWLYYTHSDSANPVTLSTNARNQIISSYNANAKWSVDPTNFLTGTDFATSAGTTCGLNMPLNTTATSYSQYYTQSTIAYSHIYSNGTLLLYDRTDQLNYYGNQTLRVKDTTGCDLAFEGVTTNTPIPNAIITTPGSIAVNALSGDDRFLVNKSYNVAGIDKQAVTMTFSPSTAQTGFVSIPMPFSIALAPNSGITGGTTLPFINTTQNFSTYFSPKTPLTPLDVCPNLSQVGSLSPLSQVYTSTSLYTSCVPSLKYVGNKYFKETLYIDLPAMTFAKHSSSVDFTATLPFASAGAFLETTYSGLKVRVSDGDNHGAYTNPTPTGNVKVQVFKADNTAYTCADYTLTVTPAVTCATADGSYTLPLTSAETASFSLLFKGTTVAAGNYIKLSYAGDGTFNTDDTSTSAFTVKKHASSLNVVQYQQGQTWTTLAPTFPTMKVGQSMDMRVLVSDGDGLSHTVIPSGILEVWMVDSADAKLDPQAATNPIYSVTLVSGTTYDSTNKLYKVTLDSSGYALFNLKFDYAAANLSLKYRYVGDSLFNASSTSTTGPLAFTN
jgi:hypothetical protein